MQLNQEINQGTRLKAVVKSQKRKTTSSKDFISKKFECFVIKCQCSDNSKSGLISWRKFVLNSINLMPQQFRNNK